MPEISAIEATSLTDDTCESSAGSRSARKKCQTPRFDKDYDPITFDMLKVKAEEFANQITLIDLPVFKSITTEELSEGAWSKKNKRSLAPNVMNFTDRFNSVCLWCQREILAYDKPSKRAEVISHFIKIAKRLAELNNMHSTFAIVSALQSHPIHRLSKTWACLGRHDRSTFDRLALLFDSDRNWERLRQHLDSLKLPCIPYLGMYLTDLNFIDAHRGGENVFIDSCTKEQKANNIIRTIVHFQDSSYDRLAYVECIQKYLASFQYHEELLKFAEDDMYKQSLLREPDCNASTSGAAAIEFLRRSSLTRKLATLSRGRLNLSATEKPKMQSMTPQLQHAKDIRYSSLCHRKTQSLGAQAVLGLENISFTLDKSSPSSPAHTVEIFSADDAVDSPDISSSILHVDGMGDRHLLDDSSISHDFGRILNIEPSSPRRSSTPNRSLSAVRTNKICFSPPLVQKRKSESDEYQLIEDENACPDWQGEARKLIIRTRGSKPTKIRCSRRCYLELRGLSLFLFERKALTIHCKDERELYKRKTSKKMALGDDGWKVIGPQNENDSAFELHHPSSGRIYRFLCKSRSAAVEWHSKLLAANSNGSPKPPANLISFD